MNCLYLVLSCDKNVRKRAAVASTWARRLEPGDDLVFVIGRPELESPIRDGDVLFVPSEDDYQSLPSKVSWAFRWAADQALQEYVFKCDDDTLVIPGRMKSLPDGDYVGFFYDPNLHDKEFPFASGGAGYRLPINRLLEIVAGVDQGIREHPDIKTIEDLLVGYAAMAVGLKPVHTELLQPINSRLPTMNNELVTAHYIGPAMMRRFDKLRSSVLM